MPRAHRTTSNLDFDIQSSWPALFSKTAHWPGSVAVISKRGLALCLPSRSSMKAGGEGLLTHPHTHPIHSHTPDSYNHFFLTSNHCLSVTAHGAYSIHSPTTHTPRPDNLPLGTMNRLAANTFDSPIYLGSRTPVKAPAPGVLTC